MFKFEKQEQVNLGLKESFIYFLLFNLFQISQLIRHNQSLEKDLDAMDIKIGLLVKNMIDLVKVNVWTNFFNVGPH